MSTSSTKSFKPRKLKLLASKKKLTNAAGLGVMIEAFDASSLSADFAGCLPERKSNRSMGSYRLGLIQLSSFLYGHDCIDDIIEFRVDPYLAAVMRGETVLPKTMGNFLRDFNVQNINAFNRFLAKQSHSYRKHLSNLYPSKLDQPPHFSIDSTPHEQSGKKMEGLAYNYKDMWCLDSQSIFDEMGFCYGIQLRSGNTKSGVDAPALINNAFKQYDFKEKKYLSADSAYCNQEIIKLCLSQGITFTIAANQATTGWRGHIDEISNWQPWEYTAKELKRAEEKNIKLPEIELGRFYWQPSWSESLRLPIVVQRKAVEQASLEEGAYEYYGIVCNHDLFKECLQSIVEHYHKRGNVENFIREEKYGYDLKHFPCQKLEANHAFGLIAMVANNFLRSIALTDSPEKTHYSKKIRRKFIHKPGHLVSHARQMVLKVPKEFLKEVLRIQEAWGLKPERIPPTCSSA